MAALLASAPGAAALAGDAPILSIEFGYDTLSVAPDQILSVQAQLGGYIPNVLVTLDPSLQFDLASLTLVHEGETAQIKVCGEVVSEPVLREAIREPAFVISTPTTAETRRLAAILQAKTCTANPTS